MNRWRLNGRAAILLGISSIVVGGLIAVWLGRPAQAGPTLAVDTLVTTHQTTAATTISSPTFSTAQPGELLVAFATSDGPNGTQSFKSVTGAGLTWQLRQRTNNQKGTAEIWQAVANATLTNVKVTAARNSGSYTGAITIASFTGANLTA